MRFSWNEIRIRAAHFAEEWKNARILYQCHAVLEAQKHASRPEEDSCACGYRSLS